VINGVYIIHELPQCGVTLREVGPRYHTGRYCFVAGCPLWVKSGHVRRKTSCLLHLESGQGAKGVLNLIADLSLFAANSAINKRGLCPYSVRKPLLFTERFSSHTLRHFRSRIKTRRCSRCRRATQTSPLLALSGHPWSHRTCPVSGVKRTLLLRYSMSSSDPKPIPPRLCKLLSTRISLPGLPTQADARRTLC